MTPEQQRYLEKTRWLRPWTRRAAAFSFATTGWLPAVIRNAPLKIVQFLLRRYQQNGSAGSGCPH